MSARPALAALAVTALVAGCGGSDSAATPAHGTATATATPLPPAPTVQHLTRAIPRAQARRLDAGAVGVIGFDLKGAVAPEQLMINHEQTLRGVRWSGWGGSSAIGRAQLQDLVCDPNCANGRFQYAPATIVLSGRKRCGRRAFYTSGRVSYVDPQTRRTLSPAVDLWPPDRAACGLPAGSTGGAKGAG